MNEMLEDRRGDPIQDLRNFILYTAIDQPVISNAIHEGGRFLEDEVHPVGQTYPNCTFILMPEGEDDHIIAQATYKEDPDHTTAVVLLEDGSVRELSTISDGEVAREAELITLVAALSDEPEEEKDETEPVTPERAIEHQHAIEAILEACME